MKKTNFIILLTVYAAICSGLFWILAKINYRIGYSEVFGYFIVGLPMIFQFILAYIVYVKNKDNKIIKVLFIMVSIYTLIFIVFSIFAYCSSMYDFDDDAFFSGAFFYIFLILRLVVYQINFQLVIAVLLIIGLVSKKVDKSTVAKYFIMYLFSILIMILDINFFIYIVIGLEYNYIFESLLGGIAFSAILVNYYSPLLLYVLSSTAREKLFIKEKEA